MFLIRQNKEINNSQQHKNNFIIKSILLKILLQKNLNKNLEVQEMQMKCLEYSRSLMDFSSDQK